MNTNLAEPEATLALLATTPRRITTACLDMDELQLRSTPEPDAWSIHEILAHLRACADVWGAGIIAMLTQDHPTLRYVSPRTWIRKTHYLELPFHASLEAFAQQRDELLKTLRALERDEWSRGATFTATTRGREQTILSYAQRIAQHENEHCEQIETRLR